MGKRKCETSEEKIHRKIRKLQQKLIQQKRRRVIYSDEENSISQSEMSPTREENSATPSPDPMVATPGCHSMPSVSLEPPSPQRSPEPLRDIDQTVTAEQGGTEEVELDGDILKLLGDAPKENTLLGPSIHKDVASRWQEILTKGLSKEVKDNLLSEYLVPSNCDFLLAPALNPEAKAAMSEPLVKRDNFLMQKQKQIGIALSALASTTTLILANETSKQMLLKPISDACRILCDSHYTETKSRRNLVISSTNTQLKDTLTESPRDKNWLFGENISEKLKVAKTIQKSGNELKNQSKPNQRPNFQNKNAKGRLNFKARRQTDKPSISNDSGRSRQQHREPPRNSNTLRNNRRSPAPRRTTRK